MTELTVLYDGSCSLCRGSVARLRRFYTHGRIELLSLHDPSAQQRFPQIDREVSLRWMQAVDARGRVSGGVDAWARIGQLLPGWNLLAWLLLIPGLHWLPAKTLPRLVTNRSR